MDSETHEIAARVALAKNDKSESDAPDKMHRKPIWEASPCVSWADRSAVATTRHTTAYLKA